MGFFSKLFGSEKKVIPGLTDDANFGSGMSDELAESILDMVAKSPKKKAYEQASRLFDKTKSEYIKVLIKGLSSQDIKERQDCANFIHDCVVPALDDDDDPRSRQSSLQTIQHLVSGLRPPSTKWELSDLDNAVFFFVKRQLLSGQCSPDLANHF